MVTPTMKGKLNMNKRTQTRIEKTLVKLNTLYGCQNARVHLILKDTRDGEFVVMITKQNGVDEYVSFDNRYVWGMRCSFFCGIEEEYNRMMKTGHYERIY